MLKKMMSALLSKTRPRHAKAIPSGFVLAPKSPTVQMLQAGHAAASSGVLAVWVAMAKSASETENHRKPRTK